MAELLHCLGIGNVRLKCPLAEQLPANEYENLPKWTRALLRDSKFDPAKILSIVKNLANNASSSKRDGVSMCSVLMSSLNSVKEYESRFHNAVVLENFHRELGARLEGEGADEAMSRLIGDLERLRAAILELPMNLQLLCDPSQVKSTRPVTPDVWQFLNRTSGPAENITTTYEKDVKPFQSWTPACRVFPLDTSNSSYVSAKQQAVVEYGGPEHVALLIFCNYLSMNEGILWNEIRGGGLAYAAQITYSPVAKSLTLLLYRSSRPVLSYDTCKKTVLDFFENNKSDKVVFDLAKKGVVSLLMNRYETLQSTAWSTVNENLRGLSMSDARKIVQGVWDAEMAESFQLAAPLLIRLFDDHDSLRAIVCPPSKVTEVRETFKDAQPTEISDLQFTPE